MSSSNDGLTVSVKSGHLEISIDIDTLMWATENAPGPFFETYECENRWKVTDPAVWADSVVLALKKEEEDGTTLVHRMFDTAFEYAIVQGFEGIEEANMASREERIDDLATEDVDTLVEIIIAAEEERDRLSRRDGNAKIELNYETMEYPFNRRELRIADFSVSENEYVVTDPVGQFERDQLVEDKRELVRVLELCDEKISALNNTRREDLKGMTNALLQLLFAQDEAQTILDKIKAREVE